MKSDFRNWWPFSAFHLLMYVCCHFLQNWLTDSFPLVRIDMPLTRSSAKRPPSSSAVNPPQPKRRRADAKDLECGVCGRKFTKPCYKRDHMRTHDPGRQKFSCVQCGSQYNDVKNWRVHFLKSHARGPASARETQLSAAEKNLKTVRKENSWLNCKCQLKCGWLFVNFNHIYLATSGCAHDMDGKNGRINSWEQCTSFTGNIRQTYFENISVAYVWCRFEIFSSTIYWRGSAQRNLWNGQEWWKRRASVNQYSWISITE